MDYRHLSNITKLKKKKKHQFTGKTFFFSLFIMHSFVIIPKKILNLQFETCKYSANHHGHSISLNMLAF